MGTLRVSVVAALLAGLFATSLGPAPAAAQSMSVVMDCGPAATSRIRTVLFFGMTRPKGGTVSELDWQLFLRDTVTPRFPDGLTVWDAQGQWRMPGGPVEHERSKVLQVVHADTPAARKAVQEVIAVYIKAFEQQSVLWESTRVCIAGESESFAK